MKTISKRLCRRTSCINAAYGPFYREGKTVNYFQFDSEWSGKRIDNGFLYKEEEYIRLVGNLLAGAQLKPEDAAFLAQAGLIKVCGGPDGKHETALQCVLINDAATEEKLVAIGDRIKKKHQAAFSGYVRRYTDAVLAETPAHLRKLREYELQFTVFGDKRFVTNCLCELVGNGKLRLPAEKQKPALSTVILRK
ncbi:MAG: hypothetical protein IJJ85_05115 [Clostridia bacterium]|nr:hypothetical protein [Clostridia bacterium]